MRVPPRRSLSVGCCASIWSAIRVIWLLNSISGLLLRQPVAAGAVQCGGVRCGRLGGVQCGELQVGRVGCGAAWIPGQARGSTGPGHRRARVCGTGQGHSPMEHHFDAGASRLLCQAEGVCGARCRWAHAAAGEGRLSCS